MPLPKPDSVWPPAPLGELLPTFYRWSAWYSGEPDQLADAYGGTPLRQTVNRPSQFANGIRGAVARIMWGNPVPDDADDDRVHVPLASDLCSATAELCYSDPPQFTSTSKTTLDRINEYVEDGMLVGMAGGVELGAAMGGRFVQAVIPAGGTRARFEQVAYDGAWPVFARGELKAVTFWWVLDADNTGRVWRHLESHELDPITGDGIIRHGLYLGTRDRIGSWQDLSVRAETSGLNTPGGPIDAQGVVNTGPGLDVVHIPGRTPQRLWRHHPIGRHLGRSILQGNEGFLSKLDDAYTSWFRDVDLGRSRLIIADWLLDVTAKGLGPSFDLDRRLITQVAMPQAFGGGAATDPIKMVQFAIRVAEHRETCQEATEVVLRAASFSANTFGEDENGNAQTATGVLSKDSRSMRTRRHVLNLERPALQTILRKALQMDQDAGNGTVADPLLLVSFPDGSEQSPFELAQTQQALRAAEAASDFTIVKMGHPDWTDQQVLDEVAMIRQGAAARIAADATTSSTFPPAGDAGDVDDQDQTEQE